MTPNNWNLRVTQIPYFLGKAQFNEEAEALARHVVAHRRGGKSFGISKKFRQVCTELLHEPEIFKIRGDVDSRNPKLAFLAPTKVQARQIIWDYFQSDLVSLPGAKANGQMLTIKIPRPLTGDHIEVMLFASKQHDRIRGLALRYAAVDEVQDAPEDFMESIKPALRDSNGEVIFSGTAKGEDHFYDLIKKAIEMKLATFLFPVTRTKVFDDKEIAQMIKEYDWGMFLREMMCDFSAPLEGAIYYNTLIECEKQHYFTDSTFCPHNTTYMACDIGVAEGFAAWVYQLSPCNSKILMRDFYTGYETMQELHDDLEMDDCMPDIIQLPHDGNKRQLSGKVVRRNRDVFREVFKHQRLVDVDKPGQKMVAINTVKQNLHMLRMPKKTGIDIMESQNIYSGKTRGTDCYAGLKKVKEHSRKKNKDTGKVTEQIDKSRGNDHAADALETAFLALNVKKGVAHRTYNYKAETPKIQIFSNFAGYRRNNYSRFSGTTPSLDEMVENNYPQKMAHEFKE